MIRRMMLVAAPLILAACGDREVASGTVSDGEGGEASYSVSKKGDEATMTIKSADGATVVRTGKEGSADALPEGLGIYPGATVTTSIAVSGDGSGRKGGQTSFETSDPAASVIAWYKAAAVKAGYSIETEMTMESLSMIGGHKDGEDGRAFQVMANKGDGKTVVTLIAGGKG